MFEIDIAAAVERDEDVPLALDGAPWWRKPRPVPVAPMAPEGLAARIDAAQDRADRVLFTVTPREELGAFAKWQRMADEAWCGQLRDVVAA
ncbi:MAG: hypothetical protein WCD35_03980, partial [Mycobacteriales bacterium]